MLQAAAHEQVGSLAILTAIRRRFVLEKDVDRRSAVGVERTLLDGSRFQGGDAGATSLNVAAFDRFDGVCNRCLLAVHWRVGL
jgi:hypothetical protein